MEDLISDFSAVMKSGLGSGGIFLPTAVIGLIKDLISNVHAATVSCLAKI